MTGQHPFQLQTKRAIMAVSYLDLPRATGIPDAVWESFQLDELNNDSMFGTERKCRQVGWSFLIALRGVMDAIIDARSSVYNSINKNESYDKIRYAKQILNSFNTPFDIPQIRTDNQSEIEFDNGARLTSTASARGIPNANFFMDEAAHKINARDIYVAAVPVISKGGMFRMGSSTNGASGLFWEVDTQSLQPYPDFVRSATKWWQVVAFCTNVASAAIEAPTLDTRARVAQFASKRLKIIFNNMVLEDFQQEYEAKYVDETTAWITWKEIQDNTMPGLKYVSAETEKEQVDNALIAINRLAGMIQRQEIENVLYGGMDIGRTRNASEIFLVGKSTVESLPLRLMLTLNKCPYDDQVSVLNKVLDVLPVAKMLIDQNGLGNQLAEKAEKNYPTKAQGVKFTNPTKELWATGAKMLFQQNRATIPPDKDLAYQIHSIKKRVTPSGNVVYDTEANEKHHADKFWAHALALDGAISNIFNVSDGVRSLFHGLGLNN